MRRTYLSLYVFALSILLLVTAAQAQDRKQLLERVWTKLGADQPIQGIPVRLRLHVSSKDEVNAWTTPKTGDIYITEKLLGLTGTSEGELAFVVAHEVGHVVGYWSGLSAQAQQAQLEADLSTFLSRLNLVFESEEDRQNRYSHVEEKLADAIGFFILKEVGYNPYDAGAFFGRLQMLAGTTDPSTRIWKPYLSDHPFNEDRIENLRQVMARLQQVEKSQPAPAPAYIWIGRFSVTVEGADGQRHVVEMSDTLGIYTEDDFRVAQAMEVQARGEVIRRFLLQRQGGQIRRVLSVDLKAIEQEVFEDQAGREKWPKGDN